MNSRGVDLATHETVWAFGVTVISDRSWGEVKADWRAESIGWVDRGEVVGAGLVLYRRPPGFERCFAYVPEGPVLDWYADEAASWLNPMVEHLRSENPFMVSVARHDGEA